MRDMKAVNVDAMSWEGLAADHTRCSTLSQRLKKKEEKLLTAAAAADNRARNINSSRPDTTRNVDFYDNDSHSRIAIFSHKRLLQLNKRVETLE